MATIEAHYERVLSGVYSWMLGGMENGLERNRSFFEAHDVHRRGSGVAVDLGAGCGFQSIPLAELGFSVTAIDLSETLLEELAAHAQGLDLDIRIVRDDLMRFAEHAGAGMELAVCMQDTLLHLDSRADVERLFRDVFGALEPDGRLVLTFRDLTSELHGLDRFIPVRSDADSVLTCFLEYEPDTVKVHDLLYRRSNGAWVLSKSYYRKLRVASEWVAERLQAAGFAEIDSSEERGIVTVFARK